MNVLLENDALPQGRILGPSSDFIEPPPYRPEFKAFPKIPRFKRYYVITEKLDGTNAAVIISPDGEQVHAQSRKRLIQPNGSVEGAKATDNFGFAQWVEQNAEALKQMGPGYHYGEWVGVGINRGYNFTSERRFYLFNTARWGGETDDAVPPACCHVVPVLATGHDNLDGDIAGCMERLRKHGSVASPGYMNPEGIVVYHTAAGSYFKILLENDDTPKGDKA